MPNCNDPHGINALREEISTLKLGQHNLYGRIEEKQREIDRLTAENTRLREYERMVGQMCILINAELSHKSYTEWEDGEHAAYGNIKDELKKFIRTLPEPQRAELAEKLGV